MKPLDPFHIDLEKATLIEASAGTGKTYTITTLYCRLAAKGYPVESILVVTFTEAAAAELKLRIRTRLFNTLTGLLEPSRENRDDLVLFFKDHENLPLVCQRLQLALNSFDQTAIMTIHSFCLKGLKEMAFESQSLFDMTLVPDRASFLRQVSYDFFMGHVNHLDGVFLAYLNQQQVTPEKFAADFGPIVSRSDLVLSPVATPFGNIFDDYRKTLEKIYQILLFRKEEIISLILNHNGIDKKSYSKKNVPAWLDASCLKLESQGVNTLFKMTEKGDALYKFTQTRLALKTKSNQARPDHVFFDLCEQLLCFCHGFENNLMYLKAEFLVFFNKELDKMKKADALCFFDDLINDFAAALEKPSGQRLQKAVRQTYKACLIDEFQDTDPRQYDIFSRLFGVPDTPFFMIGDPKQAIYTFRGGDIFAYLNAAKACEQRFTLKKNYRSASLLVEGINAVFSNKENPFLYEPIEFSKVKAHAPDRNFLVDDKESIPPLQFCFIKRKDQVLDGQGFISKETAAGIIPIAVAADILALLASDGQLIGKDDPGRCPQKISPKDIAVLVRTNKQAEQIQNALSRLNIPSYLSKTGSVFDSRQAIDLQDILWAVVYPDNKGYINAALCTTVFNFSSDMIVAMDKEEALFFKWQDQFRTYKETWESQGFVSMIMALFHSDEAFLKENTSLGQREMTNFYHLVELISQVCLKQPLSPYYVLKWYARQLSVALRDEFADELRLESDQKAVAIITIHKSKGLEYPVVYLPYLWEGPRKGLPENILFHDPEKGHQLTLDLGSKNRDKAQACFEKEDKAEQRRLLYVALTRASAMCRVFWGGFKSVETSALGTLLHQNACQADESMINDLEGLRSCADQSILVQFHLPDASRCFVEKTVPQNAVLSAGKRGRRIQPAWKISSFSGLTQSQNLEAFQDPVTSDDKGAKTITLAQFPKGAGPGDLFHLVFETLDFTKGPAEISKVVQSKFNLFGFSAPDLIHMGETAVKEVLETRLAAQTSGFCLKDIGQDQRFNEIEFVFPVKSFQMSLVQNVFEQSDLKFTTSGYTTKLSQLSAQSFNGYLKGFMDLVIFHKGKWYIVDYKSNTLGNTYDQYSQNALFDAMSDHHYFLQYHLYLVALHRYLGLRLKNYDYDTHFGGVFYLFIRGMHPDFASQYGVFYDRPTKENIQNLSDNL